MKETDVTGTRTDPHRQMTAEQKRLYYKRLKQRKKRRRQTAVMGVMLLLLIAVLIGLIVHMTRKDALRGTWMLDQVTVYEFDGKGHGGLLLPQQSYEFDYSIDGNRLHIDFRDPAANDASYYFEADKNTLILTSDDGQEYRFIRQR